MPRKPTSASLAKKALDAKKAKVKEMIGKASALELELVWIPKIMERQTWAEVAANQTNENNGAGLNGHDAEYITNLFKQIRAGKHLTEKQAAAASKALGKYAGQYASMMAR